MTIQERQAIEREIVGAVVRAALDAGYEVAVDNGEEEFKPSADADTIMSRLFTVDEEYLRMYRNGVQAGWVLLVYGNDGYDVVCDYTTGAQSNMAPLMVEAEKLADKYEAQRT